MKGTHRLYFRSICPNRKSLEINQVISGFVEAVNRHVSPSSKASIPTEPATVILPDAPESEGK